MLHAVEVNPIFRVSRLCPATTVQASLFRPLRRLKPLRQICLSRKKLTNSNYVSCSIQCAKTSPMTPSRENSTQACTVMVALQVCAGTVQRVDAWTGGCLQPGGGPGPRSGGCLADTPWQVCLTVTTMFAYMCTCQHAQFQSVLMRFFHSLIYGFPILFRKRENPACNCHVMVP